VVPAQRGKGGQPDLLAAPQILDHAGDHASGAMTVLGVKYTTARGVAARVVSHAAKRLGKRLPRSHTDRTMLPGAGIADHEALAIETARTVGLELAPPIIRHLTALYGDRCAPIIKLMAEHTDWRMPLVPGQLHVGAEVIHAVRHEMACTLADIAVRRTALGAAGHPGRPTLTAMAQIAAPELGWSDTRLNDEIEAIDGFYSPLAVN
jgi:glycerol-3-phosphate dehydrogenase